MNAYRRIRILFCSAAVPIGTVGCSDASTEGQPDASIEAAVDASVEASVDSAANLPDGPAPDVAAEASTPCSPATLLDPQPWEACPSGNAWCQCYGYMPDAGGLFFDPKATIMAITALQLPQPMEAGVPYSLSAHVANGGFSGDVEFWGATSQCGPGWQKLYAAPVESKVYCADVNPTDNYTYLLWVEKLYTDSGAPAGEHSDTILACPTGRCM
jgi:hypothetical protein